MVDRTLFVLNHRTEQQHLIRRGAHPPARTINRGTAGQVVLARNYCNSIKCSQPAGRRAGLCFEQAGCSSLVTNQAKSCICEDTRHARRQMPVGSTMLDQIDDIIITLSTMQSIGPSHIYSAMPLKNKSYKQ
jgi:hypothetical protein